MRHGRLHSTHCSSIIMQPWLACPSLYYEWPVLCGVLSASRSQTHFAGLFVATADTFSADVVVGCHHMEEVAVVMSHLLFCCRITRLISDMWRCEICTIRYRTEMGMACADAVETCSKRRAACGPEMHD